MKFVRDLLLHGMYHNSLHPTDFRDLGGKKKRGSMDSGLRYRENSRTFLTWGAKVKKQCFFGIRRIACSEYYCKPPVPMENVYTPKVCLF